MKESENSIVQFVQLVLALLLRKRYSETEIEEVSDYIVHFCGLECYEKWHKEKTDND